MRNLTIVAVVMLVASMFVASLSNAADSFFPDIDDSEPYCKDFEATSEKDLDDARARVKEKIEAEGHKYELVWTYTESHRHPRKYYYCESRVRFFPDDGGEW